MRVQEHKYIILGSLCALILTLTVAYAAFQSVLKIKGTSNITSEWNILITNVEETKKGGEAITTEKEGVTNPNWDGLTANIEADLVSPGDFIEYEVTVENRGTLDAKLNEIKTNTTKEHEAILISFSGYTKGEKLEKGTSQKIIVRIEYNPEFEGIPEIGSKEVNIELEYNQNDDYKKEENGEITSPDRYLVTYDCETNGGNKCINYNEYLKEGEAINLTYKGTHKRNDFIGWNTDKDAKEGIKELTMLTEEVTLYAIYRGDPIIQSWGENDTTDFHSEAYKQSIISAEFLDNKNIPDNAVESWDVSAAKDESVMAWVIPDTTDNTKHHLYIGGNQGVIANEDSSFLFLNFKNINSIEFHNNYDTSNTTNMLQMFGGSANLVSLDLSSFDTKNVKNLSYMFAISSYAGYGMKLESIKFGNKWDTSNATTMQGMFYNCWYLVSIDVSKFNTTNVTSMLEMFCNCKNLTKLNLCSFDTRNVTTMQRMFTSTTNLEKVYVGANWTMANVTNSANMWYGSKISSVTQSNNCEVEAEDPATINLATTKTTNSITVVSNAKAESGIEKYEYSKDGGATWETGKSIHTFTGLDQGTTYNIKVRVTSKIGKVTISDSAPTITNTLSTPTFNGSENETTITFEEGCGDTLTCTYKYNDKEEVNVTTSTVTVPIDQAGNIVAKISDGKNEQISSNTVFYNDLYVSNTGDDNVGYGTKEKPYATVNKAYSMSTQIAQINVMDNITANETTTFNQEKDITITSYSETDTQNSIIRGNSLTSYVLNNEEGSLTLENIIIDGNNVEAISSAIIVYPGAHLDLLSETIIKNCITTTVSGSGGAIRMNDGTSDNYASITMNGATITNNHSSVQGGGIYAANNSKLVIEKGTFSNNSVTSNGGAISCLGCNFTMNNGTISNNSSEGSSGGIYLESNAKGIINNGIITGNSATVGGGIAVVIASLTIENGTISNNNSSNDGGGIYCIKCTGTIGGGNITENFSSGVGGGVSMVNGGVVTMNGGIISNNKAMNGGGGIGIFQAANQPNTEFILNGGTISNNIAEKNYGGIHLHGNTGKYTYKKGTVCGNTPSNSYETHSTCPAS